MQFEELTEAVIGCAIEVHRQLGPGLLESTYEAALCVELELAGLKYRRQVCVPVVYKGRTVGEYRIDLLVEDTIIVEIKSVERHDPVFEAQLLTYLRVTGKKVAAIQTVKNPTSRRAPRWLRQRLSDLRQPLLAAFPAPGRLPLILRPPPACDR